MGIHHVEVLHSGRNDSDSLKRRRLIKLGAYHALVKLTKVYIEPDPSVFLGNDNYRVDP